MSSAVCERCHRGLKDPESVKLGMGPVCRAKSGKGGGDMFKDDGRTIADLPFDPESMDVVCSRRPTGEHDWDGHSVLKTHFNISQAVVSHSPSGFEWGYGGSGPADFALNVLNLFVPPRADGFAPVKCYDGECSSTAWALHNDFKESFIAPLPKDGGRIRGADIRAWLSVRVGLVNCGGCYSAPCVCHTFEE
jgi:hypothetical protein